MGVHGRTEALRSLSISTYADWLEARVVRAGDHPTALPVAKALYSLTGEGVEREVRRLVDRYGPAASFHLVCGRRCYGKQCHGHSVARLFGLVAEASEPAPFPKEVKPTVPEIMHDLAVLSYLSALTGLQVYQLVSDIKDFFNQHKLAHSERHKVGLVTLDPKVVAASAERLAQAHRERDPELVSVAENVLGYSLFGASNVAQRTAHLLVFVWLARMAKAAERHVKTLRQGYPVIDHWLASRARRLEPGTDAGWRG